MNFEQIFLNGCIYSLSIAAVLTIIHMVKNKINAKNKPNSIKPLICKASKESSISGLENFVMLLTVAGFFSITASIMVRTFETGHGPFTSMYEFSIAFVWGILMLSIFFSWKYQTIIMIFAGTIISIVLLIFANSISMQPAPLVPALQNSILLSVHVASAVVAYGAFAIGFIASILFMMQKNDRFSSLPKSKDLEKISYHSVIIGFPFMTLVIVLGALWADIAWGRYWGWDPKETASLLTWLIYAGYLHTRVIRGYQGRRTALLLIIGFVAVIFTFFGNYIFNGLHSYV